MTLLPANFPIGSHVTVVSSHPKHANATGVVTRCTTKFITFSPVDFPQDRTRILPQLLLLAPPPAVVPPEPCNSRTTQRRVALYDAEDDQSRMQGQKERDNDAYDKLPETANFHVADEYVRLLAPFAISAPSSTTFFAMTTTSRREASATAAMGALKEVWRNPHLDISFSHGTPKLIV